MIPRCSEPLESAIPSSYGYWTPTGDDISEEGIGYFRDTWLITDVDLPTALEIIDIERRLVSVADTCSEDAHKFDEAAAALELSNLDEVPLYVRESNAFVAIASHYSHDDSMPLVDGLDLGVAGLVYALAAMGAWPAASCRGHGPRGWAPYPVVYMAVDRSRAEALQPLVRNAGCGFVIDPARDHLLVVRGPSVTEMMDLAAAIVELRETFSSPGSVGRSIMSPAQLRLNLE